VQTDVRMLCKQTHTGEIVEGGIRRRTHGPRARLLQRLVLMVLAGNIAGGLSACAGGGYRTEEQPQRYPENYKTELVQFLHIYINDATNIRNASIADPMLIAVDIRMEPTGVTARPPPRAPGTEGRVAGDTEPAPIVGERQRYVVCVRYNAKDRDGRYAGLKQGMAIYTAGRFERFSEPAPAVCNQVEFKPFPELEKLGR
jgi:hypothetical protein